MPVIVPACCGGLVSAARCPLLLLPHSFPAAFAAIALAAITTRADSEKCVAGWVKASPHAQAFYRPICCHCTAHSQHQYARNDRTDDWRLRRNDVARPRPKFRKLRFQMIADIYGIVASRAVWVVARRARAQRRATGRRPRQCSTQPPRPATPLARAAARPGLAFRGPRARGCPGATAPAATAAEGAIRKRVAITATYRKRVPHLAVA
jgi:hypothetical protein